MGAPCSDVAQETMGEAGRARKIYPNSASAGLRNAIRDEPD